jgi:hypothetical protein
MEAAASPELTNGKTDHYSVTTEALAEQISDVSSSLKTLAQRFDAHAEQEQERAKKTDERITTLANSISQGSAIPTTLLTNLFAQQAEGQGPTGPTALTVSSMVGALLLILPRIITWYRARQAA